MKEKLIYRNGIFGDFWRDFERHLIQDDAPGYQRRAMQQAFIGGGVAHLTCFAAILSAVTPGDTARVNALVDELETEIREMTEKVVAEAIAQGDDKETQADSEARAIRASLAAADAEYVDGDVKVKTFAKGLSEDEANALGDVISDFIAGMARDKRGKVEVKTTHTIQ